MLEKLRTLGWDIQLELLAVATLLLGIPLARSHIDRVVVFPESLYVIVTIVGTLVGILALVGLVAFLIDLAIGRSRTWCECRPVSSRNIHEVFELMHDFFEDETPSKNRMRQWQRKNKNVLTAVYLQGLTGGRKRSTLVGVYKIVPLTRSAVAALASERKTGATIETDDITAENEQPAGLYIGDVVAVTGKAKGEVIRQLKNTVAKLLRPGLSIYTRPLTRDGVRLVRKYQFITVSDGIAPGSTGRIHMLPEDRARLFLG